MAGGHCAWDYAPRLRCATPYSRLSHAGISTYACKHTLPTRGRCHDCYDHRIAKGHDEVRQTTTLRKHRHGQCSARGGDRNSSDPSEHNIAARKHTLGGTCRVSAQCERPLAPYTSTDVAKTTGSNSRPRCLACNTRADTVFALNGGVAAAHKPATQHLTRRAHHAARLTSRRPTLHMVPSTPHLGRRTMREAGGHNTHRGDGRVSATSIFNGDNEGSHHRARPASHCHASVVQREDEL